MLAASKPWPGASISAYPPPWQKPMTPVLPVQSSRSSNHVRAASRSLSGRDGTRGEVLSSTLTLFMARISPMKASMHLILRPQ